jgi:hypothetical protein
MLCRQPTARTELRVTWVSLIFLETRQLSVRIIGEADERAFSITAGGYY